MSRLIKFMRLIVNEWKKEFHKVVFWIMIVLLVLGTVGFSFFSTVTLDLSGLLGFTYSESFDDYCSDEIESYRQCLSEADPESEDVEFYRTQIEIYTIMLESNMDWEDWRYQLSLADAAVEAKRMGDMVSYAAILEVIEKNDTALYFTYLKNGYTEMLAYDPELCLIYTETMDYCIEHKVIPLGEDWRFEQANVWLENREAALKQERLRDTGGAWSEAEWEKARNTAAVAKYRLDNDISANPADSFSSSLASQVIGGMFGEPIKTSKFWNAMVNSTSVLTLVSVCVIVLAGTTVSSEFSSGTIKFLLMSPVKRWKLLTAKYFSVLSLVVALTALVAIVTFAAALPFDIFGAFTPAVYAEDGQVTAMTIRIPYLMLLENYLLASLKIVVMGTMAFSLSSLFRVSALAIAIPILADLGGTFIVAIMQLLGLDFGRYLLFSNLDLLAIANGNGLFPHQSLFGAIVILVLHMIVFLWTAWDAFVKREV